MTLMFSKYNFKSVDTASTTRQTPINKSRLCKRKRKKKKMFTLVEKFNRRNDYELISNVGKLLKSFKEYVTHLQFCEQRVKHTHAIH